MTIIGIDLGTTNSLMAQLDNVGQPKIIHNSEGLNLTPSAICFDPEKIQVGSEAKARIAYDEPNVYRAFKREMGSSDIYKNNPKSFTPTDLSALILQKLKNDAQQSLGAVESVVITVPANFRNEAREATLAAAKAVGFSDCRLINEPTAAALYYSSMPGNSLSGIYAVYDLGGGTFDVTIIKAHGQDIEVLSSEGIQQLGGEDFDRKIVEIVSKKFKDKTGKDFNLFDYGFTQLDAEDVKKSLSVVSEKKVRLLGKDIEPTIITITRSEFEEAISALIVQSEMVCESAIIEAGLKVSDVKEVILAGGSSRIPLVKKVLNDFFGKEPKVLGNPDEAIALGAAIYAGFKADKNKLNPLQAQAVGQINFQEVTPHYFGTIIVSGDKLVNTIIINKNEKSPCSVTDSFYTVHDDQQSVNCQITQSPQIELDPRFVRVIWDGDLELPPGRPKGQEIKITYSYTENGTMNAQFVDVASNNKKEVNLNAKNLSASARININDFIVE